MRFISFIMLLFLPGVNINILAQPKTPRKEFKVFQFPNSHIPDIDGDLSDWDMVPEEYIIGITEHTEQTQGLGKNHNPEDMDVKVKAAWNDSLNRIYFACWFYDDYHNFDRDPNKLDRLSMPGADDIFEVVIDADNSGGSLIQFEGKAKGELYSTSAQNYHIWRHERDGLHSWQWGYQEWLNWPPYAQWASQYDVVHGESGTSTLEFYITPFNYASPKGPQLSAVHDLTEDKVIGLDWAILDYDGANKQFKNTFWSLADEVNMYGDADYLSNFTLMPVLSLFDGLPRTDFSAFPPTKETPRTVRFMDRTRGGKVTSWLWDFGDGKTSTEQNPEHSYSKPGRYTVRLSVNEPKGSHTRVRKDAVRIPE